MLYISITTLRGSGQWRGARQKVPNQSRGEVPVMGAKRLGFSNELWTVVELCWLEDRNARPGVEDILSCLNDAAAFWYMRDY